MNKLWRNAEQDRVQSHTWRMSSPSAVTIRSWPAAGGGLLIGATTPALKAKGSDGLFHPDVFLRVGLDDNVSVIIPDAPLDDGTASRVLAIVADELQLPKERIWSDYGWNAQWRHQGSTCSPDVADAIAECLRAASATTLTMLLCAAAETWCVVPNECCVRAAVVQHISTGRHFRYGVLAGDAARQQIPRRVRLRDGGEYAVLSS